MDLLQSFGCAHLYAFYKRAFKQVVCLLLAFSINGIIAVCEPFYEAICRFGRKLLA